MVSGAARVRAAALTTILCLVGCLPEQARATSASVASALQAPNLTGAAAIADGTSARPYQAVVKQCYPFSMQSATGVVTGYLVKQIDTLDSNDSPFNVQYTVSNASYDGTLQLLK
jgi:hypothetical protein